MTQISGLDEEKTTAASLDRAAIDDSADSWTTKYVELRNWLRGVAARISTIELGHSTDTTVARSAAGVVSVEGVDLVDVSSSQTITNKQITTIELGHASDTTVARVCCRSYIG